MSHTVFIRNLSLRCIVGVRPPERQKKQPVLINVSLGVDADELDALEATVDYSALHDRIVRLVEGSSFGLIESLARAIAACCLEERRVEVAEVTVEKPHALAYADSAGVTVRVRRGAEEER